MVNMKKSLLKKNEVYVTWDDLDVNLSILKQRTI